MTPDSVDLTQAMVRVNSANPPGGEQAVADLLLPILESAGFTVTTHQFASGRPTLLATIGDQSPGVPLVFAGHIDTVPLGKQHWSVDPLGGEITNGRLHGRGSSDMKSGIAAMVTAAVAAARGPLRRGIALVICAGEESGCEGSVAIAEAGMLPTASALVVPEPTDNQVVLGHKGALWLQLTADGRAAHGSMPHLGDNAVTKLAHAVGQLDQLEFGVEPDGFLGPMTLNVGRFHGGENINSVPDQAVADVDIRTVPGPSHATLLDVVQRELSDGVVASAAVDLPPVVTRADDPLVTEIMSIASPVTGHADLGPSVSYFTDASALMPALGNPPTVIFGPGRAEQAHQTDEFCEVARIEQADAVFAELIRRWCA